MIHNLVWRDAKSSVSDKLGLQAWYKINYVNLAHIDDTGIMRNQLRMYCANDRNTWHRNQ